MITELPKNWIETTLGTVTTKPQYGWTTKSQNFGEYKYLRTTDIGKGNVKWDSVPFCIDLPNNVEDYVLCKDDIVISRAGSIGFSYLVKEIEPNVLYASYLIRFKPIITPRLISYFLQSNFYWKAVSDSAVGIAVKNINAPKLQSISFPLPPLPEQERIVAKLDSLFAQHEVMKKALERIPQLLKDFRKQVLMQAITGELTVGWRDEKKISKNRMYLDEKVKILSDSLLPMKSPKSWNLIHLGYLLEDLTDYHANGSYEILKENVTLLEDKSYAAMIRSTNFEKNNFNDLLIYINEKAYNFLSKSKLHGGEILISKIGNAGSVYFMPKLDMPSSLAMNLFMLRINNRYNNKYIYYHLISEFSKENTNKYVRGVTTKSIDKISVRSLTINLPPFEEQQEIVTRIESLFLKADVIEKRYKILKEKIDSLPQAILHKAFKGELVPQLPTDGDAKDLLKEILKLKSEVKKK
ncbi:restriction endonuclease subunit S [Chryseobacterium lathyri]|uniref:restriction endonuclease subunit S n=1 Tax=Chryseobacterium lathyri TaxID=395933 RepID=UPI001CC0776C|nr:restriction endonuclease subunit S [Chryseobacterium lathyri]